MMHASLLAERDPSQQRLSEFSLAEAARWCEQGTVVRGRVEGGGCVLGIVRYVAVCNGLLAAFILEQGWTGAWVALETLEPVA
jgi:hypothetical protein